MPKISELPAAEDFNDLDEIMAINTEQTRMASFFWHSGNLEYETERRLVSNEYKQQRAQEDAGKMANFLVEHSGGAAFEARLKETRGALTAQRRAEAEALAARMLQQANNS